MHITKEVGMAYIKSIAKYLGELTDLKVKCIIKNLTMAAGSGNDPKRWGHADIHIVFTAQIYQKYLFGHDVEGEDVWEANQEVWEKEKGTETLLEFNISELPPCGLAMVDGLTVFGMEDGWDEYEGADMKYIKGVSKHCLNAMHLIMDIFATNDGQKAGGGYEDNIYTDRYGHGKTLMFAGNNDDNDLYPALGFVKVAPYNNTRYEGNSRHIYLFESRKRRDETVRKYKSFPRWAVKKFATIRSARRENSFFNEIAKRNKPEEDTSSIF